MEIIRTIRKNVCALSAGILLFSCAAVGASADSAKYMTLKGRQAAKITSDGTYHMIDTKDPALNADALAKAMSDNKKRKVILPKGTYRINKGITVGSNKTLSAVGTKIVQTDPRRQLINNACTKTNYNSVKNVSIIGGTWYITDNKKMLRDTSTIRFNHGQNIKLKDCTIYTNYRSHGVELIACKNVKMLDCKVISEGKPAKNSIEEAVQIDIATAKTAPTCADKSGKFVSGQTCRDITLDGCTITGCRGVCCNRTDSESGKYLSKMHRNIKILNCSLKGVTAEGLVLHNTQGFTVKNNVIISNSTDRKTLHSCGISAVLFGSFPDYEKYGNVISGNFIKGNRFALSMTVKTAKKSKNASYGTTIIKDNKLYCKRGKKYAMSLSGIPKMNKHGNKCYKWK